MEASRMDMTIAEAAAIYAWRRDIWGYFLLVAMKDRSDLVREKVAHPEGMSRSAWQQAVYRIRRAENARFAQMVSIREYLSNLERLCQGPPGQFRMHREKLRYLEKAGFTCLDSVAMLLRRTPVEMIARLPKERILNMEVFLLRTLSVQAWDWIAPEGEGEYIDGEWVWKKPRRLSVRELLYADVPDWRKKTFAHSFRKMRRLLRQLGFTEKDGPFMEEDTSIFQKVERLLVVEEGLSAFEAKKFAEIALRRNWV